MRKKTHINYRYGEIMKISIKTAFIFIKMIFPLIGILLSVDAISAGIEKPDFVDDVSEDDLDDAGETINNWILAVMAIVIALSALRPSFYFFKGENDKAMDHTKDIIFGVASATFLGAVIFTLF